MAKSNIISKTGNFIQDNKIPLLYLGGAIIVVIAVIPIIRRLYSILDPSVRGAKDVDSIFKDIKIDMSKTTITEVQAKVMANQLVNYMSVSDGTDEDGIESVFNKIKNEDDMKLLYVTFGKRPYSFVNTGEASGVLGGVFENAGGYDETDLIGWLELELSNTWLFGDASLVSLINEKLSLMGLSIGS